MTKITFAIKFILVVCLVGFSGFGLLCNFMSYLSITDGISNSNLLVIGATHFDYFKFFLICLGLASLLWR